MKEKRRGSALAESILLIAISLVLVVVLFYPQIVKLFNTVMESLNTWFSNSLEIIGIT